MRSVIQSSGINDFAAGTYYSPLGQSDVPSDYTTEATAKVPLRTAGILQGLKFRKPAGGANATATITLRKNGADGNQVASAGAGLTGEFQDTTHTDAITAGDLINFKIVTATSDSWLTDIQILFNADSKCLSKFCCTTHFSSSAVDTRYACLSGVDNTSTVESDCRLDSQVAGTWKNLSVYVSANARTDVTTFGSRVNGANGNLAVSIASSATGLFEDTSNSDTIAVGDDMNYYRTIAAGSGSLTFDFISSELLSSDGTFLAVNGRSTGYTLGFGDGTKYWPVSGYINDFSTWHIFTAQHPMTWRALTMVVKTNTLNAGSTSIILQNNGSNSSLGVSVIFGTTGTFQELAVTTDVKTVSYTSYVKISNSGAGSGSIIVTNVALKGELYEISDVLQSRGVIPTTRPHSYPVAMHDYNVAAGTFGMATLTGGATSLSLGDDTLSNIITLPFNFQFFGIVRTLIRIGSNGCVSFLPGASEPGGYNAPIETNSDLAGFAYPYSTDLDQSSSGTIKYETQGSAGSRIFIVEWNAVPYFDSVDTVTLQAKFFEADNHIEFHVQDASNDGDSTNTKYDIVQGISSFDNAIKRYYSGRNNFQTALTNDCVTFTPV